MRSAALACLFALPLGLSAASARAAERGTSAELEEQFRLGEEAWKASCPRPTEDGSCIELRQTRRRPRVFVVDRDPALVVEARRHFLMAATLWRHLGGGALLGAMRNAAPNGTPPSGADYTFIFRVAPHENDWESSSEVVPARAPPGNVGAARAAAGIAFYLAEAEFEQFVRLKPPFDPAEGWDGPAGDAAARRRHRERRFTRYLIGKLDRLARTHQMYLAVFAMRQAPFDVAAVARIGQLYEELAHETGSDLPGEGTPAGDLLDQKTAAAFEKCFDLGTKNARYDEWFRLCARELTSVRPSEFPPVNELVPAPDHADDRLAPVPVVSRLDSSRGSR